VFSGTCSAQSRCSTDASELKIVSLADFRRLDSRTQMLPSGLMLLVHPEVARISMSTTYHKH